MDAKSNVKGTRDILPNETEGFLRIESVLRTIASLYNYHELRTPILEYSEVFARGVGEGSDIVRKEMYTFLDKGDRSVTMRPEFTAGIIRSVIQNKLYATNELPLKLVYAGPAFRYERPQLGRYRQFTQFGVESVGHNNVLNDFEVISMAYSMLYSLGLTNVKVKINCLGDTETRNNYREALKAYFLPHLENMCPDCKQRYELNPLRILDCKVPSDHELAKGAPKISEYLSVSSKERFNTLLNALEVNEIPYEIDDQLVRGLDYYSEVVFEFDYTSKAGKNYGALGGGGHYSNLMKELGGPDMPGVGFSFGIERLYDVLKDDGLINEEDTSLDVYVMPMGEEVSLYALSIANRLRLNGYSSDYCFDNVKLGNMFKRASKKKAKFAIIIGENEVNNHKLVVKDLQKEEQEEIDEDNLIDYFDAVFNQEDCKCKCNDECCSGEDCK
ncbi:MAG: histidine--tRNA ligase [Bacilli bacterium]|nr:histidine--tRNA ligase [Bacilli bacterium]